MLGKSPEQPTSTQKACTHTDCTHLGVQCITQGALQGKVEDLSGQLGLGDGLVNAAVAACEQQGHHGRGPHPMAAHRRLSASGEHSKRGERV